jgi:RNA polymerase sigma-70 factor (ECF subfamily)
MSRLEPLLKISENSDIEKLIRSSQMGDLKAFEEIYNMFKNKMYNIAFRMHGNEDDAADSLQEAFIKIYKNLNNFRFESSFFTWFYRILMNTCLDNLNNMNEYENSLSINPENNLDRELIENEINNLPTSYRTAFVLYEIEGFNHQEISGILRISVGTSKSNLHRAKEILKSKLRNYF